MEHKTCTKCHEVKQLSEYRPRKGGKFQRDSVCRECQNANDAVRQRSSRARKREERLASRVNLLMSIPATTLAYLAGIIDGEGSIGIYRSTRTEAAGGHYFVARISVYNTSSKLIDFVRSKFACGSVRKKKPSQLSKKPCYCWCVTSNSAGNVAEAVLPYLIVKERQAELILELQKLIRNRDDLMLSDENLTARQSLYEEAVSLNAKVVNQDE